MRLVANKAFRDIYANAYRKPGEEFECKDHVAPEFIEAGLAKKKAAKKATKKSAETK